MTRTSATGTRSPPSTPQNAVADAAKRGVSLQGTVCYVTHYPCVNCAKMLAAAGIAEVRYRHDYKNDPLVAELFTQSGVKVARIGA